MKEQIILAGFGGQGVMLAGMLLTYGGMLEGKEVCWLPSYGPEMRGGTANCHVTLSDKPISSPIITHATSSIIMNKPSLEKFEHVLCKNGVEIINSSLIDDKPKRDDIRVFNIPVNDLAVEAGSNKTANIVVLGAYVQITGAIKKQSCLDAIELVLGKKNPKLLPLNIQAFEKGFLYAHSLAGSAGD